MCECYSTHIYAPLVTNVDVCDLRRNERGILKSPRAPIKMHSSSFPSSSSWGIDSGYSLRMQTNVVGAGRWSVRRRWKRWRFFQNVWSVPLFYVLSHISGASSWVKSRFIQRVWHYRFYTSLEIWLYRRKSPSFLWINWIWKNSSFSRKTKIVSNSRISWRNLFVPLNYPHNWKAICLLENRGSHCAQS